MDSSVSWKRVGRRALGVDVPVPEGEEVSEARMPERMATPMVPQPRTVMVREGAGASVVCCCMSGVVDIVAVGFGGGLGGCCGGEREFFSVVGGEVVEPEVG